MFIYETKEFKEPGTQKEVEAAIIKFGKGTSLADFTREPDVVAYFGTDSQGHVLVNGKEVEVQ